MKFLKSHFALSKSQQNGIFVLVCLIMALQVFIFMDVSEDSAAGDVDTEEIQAWQKQLDSLNLDKTESPVSDSIYPFNPNYITDFKGYRLGMSPREIDRLLEYRASGKWINSARDFQKVTGVSDSVLAKLAVSFRFPEWTQKSVASETNRKEAAIPDSRIIDLNSATAEDLLVVNGVGEVLSQRIVKYRNSIGGFLSADQLNDVYGLKPEVVDRINQRFKLLSQPPHTRKNLNTISESELGEIPYFNRDIARAIVRYRKLHDGISHFEELSKIDGFPSDKIDRIKLYLTVE